METKVNTRPANAWQDMNIRLSFLWLFAMLNYLYADIMGHMDAGVLKQILSGTVGGVVITPTFLLIAAVLMETAIVMVVLARFLPPLANRWANVIAALIHTAAVLGSLFVDSPALYYVFFATIEVTTTLFILWFAIRWKTNAS